MYQSIEDYEKTCKAMGLHLSPEQLTEKYNEYVARLEADRNANPEKWAKAEEQEKRQRLNDQVYFQSFQPTWKR